MNGKRGLLRVAALGQGLLLVVAGCQSPAGKGANEEVVRQALVGADGPRTVNGADTIVNTYAALAGDAAAGDSTLNVATGGLGLAAGDLVLVIQMTGATISTANTLTDGVSDYGSVTNLNNAGNYELVGVTAVTANRITLACPLQKSYTVATAGNPVPKAQVIRVPQYTNLTVTGAGTITAPVWNGTIGGVVAFHAANTLQLNGTIDVSELGFRGGATDDTSGDVATNVTTYRSTAQADGAEKGESIAGLAVNLANGRYGRGAPANGGGGGNSHNGGGGGGANAAAAGLTWTGQGVMLTTAAGVEGGTLAWPLDPSSGGGFTNSPGGGRGGYSYSNANLNATLAVGKPDSATWGGNYRRERGGLGGHPLSSSPGGRLFLGGGGGAGDGNDGSSGPGGRGGGLVFVIAGTVDSSAGTGRILANGAAGGNANSGTGSGDAPGGGGGGGTVVVHAAALSAISVEARGGRGGIQTVNNGNEAEGPGGGGGGGYIALSGGTPAEALASRGLGGTTTSAALTEFPSNGATAGHDGRTDGDATTILYCTSSVVLDTVIASAPSNPTNTAVGTFTFTSPQSGVTFECSLDRVDYVACPASYSTPALGDGDHTIDVRARDTSGNVDLTPAHYGWTVNLVGPDTAIASGPATLTNVAAAPFTFTSPQSGVTFECSLDRVDYVACPASYTTPGTLSDGPHTIDVRAKDGSGVVDTTPAHYAWTLDRVPPSTTIVTYPPNPSSSSTGAFTFSGSDPEGGAVTFECRLDGASFAACPADYTINGLANGSHTLDVRARDLAGNVDGTPASYTWEVHALGLDAGVDAASPDAAAVDVLVLEDAGAPDTVIDGSGTIGLDTRVADLVPDRAADNSIRDTPVGTADAQDADAVDLADADGGGRDADAQDTRVMVVDAGFPEASVRPDLATLIPDAQIPLVADAAAPLPIPDAAEPAVQQPKVMGSGFCAVNPMQNSAPGLFTFFLMAAFGLLVFRRRR
jgi:hypothetical protein